MVHHGPDGNTDVNVCSYAVSAGTARCFARVRTDAAARSERPSRNDAGTAASVGNNGAYDPAYLESAYNVPWFVGTTTTPPNPTSAGTGQTVAIVDAYDDPNAASDLSSYRSFFGLPTCTTSNGCFKKVDEFGGTNYPSGSTSWGDEISLDLDMVSAICPNCHILLVEARSANFSDLGTAVNEAVSLGANAVSNSYGGSEYPTEVSDSTSYYDHPGVAVVAASGDNGYGVSFPAASPTVTDAGGTSLNQATDTGTRNATETVWSGAGSGCSAYEAKPSWQTDSGCADRTVADTSAVANPSTGVWVYDSYGGGTWYVYGGTSVASPIVSSFFGLAQNPAGGTSGSAASLYSHTAELNRVTSGSNGSCGSYLCNAAYSLLNGYNGPTGLGTPNGLGAFTATPPNPNLPGAPTGVSAQAGNAQATVSFTPPDNTGKPAISSYTVTAADSTNAGRGGQSASGPSSGIPVTGLTNGDSYTFTVTATNSAGTGPASAPSSPVVPSTVPGAPSGVSAQAGNAQATVSFTAPNNGGSTITSYAVTADDTTGSNGGQVAYGASSPVTVSGLTNGDSYTFTVTATNADGTGPSSSPSNTVTPTATATVPSAPQNPSAREDTSRGTDVSWNAPASNGGSPITSYTLYRSTRSGSERAYVSVGLVNCTSSSCTYHDSNTRHGYRYYYMVAAVNVVGTGAKSTEVNAIAR
ncbi:MAG TPA: hypothetical protein DCQ30_04990 [Acidimicrobiaceae bacterium]|nr:hypothetical protein [Acidimicrobiaceae bacterium]